MFKKQLVPILRFIRLLLPAVFCYAIPQVISFFFCVWLSWMHCGKVIIFRKSNIFQRDLILDLLDVVAFFRVVVVCEMYSDKI